MAGLFPLEGAGIIEVDASDGAQTIWTDDVLGPSVTISPDGEWIAYSGLVEDRPDGPHSLILESSQGHQYLRPYDPERPTIVAQVTFSPDGQWAAWLEMSQSPEGDSVELYRMDLVDGASRLLRVLEAEADLENLALTGAWLSSRLPAINDLFGSRIVDLGSGD
jgi:hypothetical protein